MNITVFASASALALVAAPTVAQTPPLAPIASPPASPAATVVTSTIAPIAAPSPAVLRVGTVVTLKTSEALTTKNKVAHVGQRFRLEVAEDVKLDGQIVLPVGSPAMGEITEVRNKGMWGKSGHLTAQVLYVDVNGRQIRLRGTFDDKGVTGTAGVVAAIAFVPVAGFFTTGTSANIPIGAGVKAFVDEDVPLAFAAAQAPVPMVVPTPAAALPVAPVTAPAPAPAPAGVTMVSAPASTVAHQ